MNTPHTLRSLVREYGLLGTKLAVIRIGLIALIFFYMLVMQQVLQPLVYLEPVRRYLFCLNNLLWVRIAMQLMGVSRCNVKNNKFFTESYQNGQVSKRGFVKFASGWIGVANYANFVDFLYFLAYYSPTFVRMIQYHEEKGVKKLLYEPLSLKQAFASAFSKKGFDPVVLNGRKQYARYKGRKVQIKNLVTQLHQSLGGAILVLVPQLKSGHMLTIPRELCKSLIENGIKFQRLSVAFHTKIMPLIQQSNKQNKKNQGSQNFIPNMPLNLLFYLCSKFKSYETMTIAATVNKQNKWIRLIDSRNVFDNPVNNYYKQKGCKYFYTSISQYLNEAEKIKNRKVDQDEAVKDAKKQNKKNKKKKFTRSCK